MLIKHAKLVIQILEYFSNSNIFFRILIIFLIEELGILAIEIENIEVVKAW